MTAMQRWGTAVALFALLLLSTGHRTSADLGDTILGFVVCLGVAAILVGSDDR